jgi:hypothetical protein
MAWFYPVGGRLGEVIKKHAMKTIRAIMASAPVTM